MKKSLLIFIAVLMYRGFSAVPDFNSITTITVGGKPFDMAPAVGFASPQVIDWDGDGKKDLLVGEFANGGGGKIRLYKNTGTNNSPQFSTFEYLKAGGQEINVSSS